MNNPTHPSAERSRLVTLQLSTRLLLRAFSLYQDERRNHAEKLCHEALCLDPNLGMARVLLARIARDKNEMLQAETELRAALRTDQSNIDALQDLVALLLDLNRGEDAWEIARSTQKQNSQNSQTLILLAQTAEATGRHSTAADLFKKCWENNPKISEHLENAIRLYITAGFLEKAENFCLDALKQFPESKEFLILFVQILQELGRRQEAETVLRDFLRNSPDNPKAWAQLGRLCQEIPSRLDEAEQCYTRALRLEPNWIGVLSNLGNIHYSRNNLEKARKIWSSNSKPELLVKNALSQEIIPVDIASINSTRARAYSFASRHPHEVCIHDPVRQIGLTNFYTAYHDISNKKLHQAIAQMHHALCPRLGRGLKSPGVQNLPRRIGVISQYFKLHTISDYFANILEMIQQCGLPLIIFTFEDKPNPVLRNLARHAQEICRLPQSIWAASDIIATKKLDVLMYLDIGMDPITYFLAFLRHAPIQCTMYGHPDTTGIKNIDSFISPGIFEDSTSDNEYSETLIRLPGLMCGITRHTLQKFTRNDLGLPNDGKLYLCPQSLFKIHPKFDAVLREICNQDKDARILFFRANNPYWTKSLTRRLDLAENLVWLDQTSLEKFLAICNVCDAVLDPPSFSGGATSFKLLGTGTPVVAWHGKFMRSRQTAGLYRYLELDGPVAQSNTEYIAQALRLAHDSEWKVELRTELNESAHRLFDIHESAHALKAFLQDPTSALSDAPKT